MREIIFEIIEDEIDGGFTASALGHAIVTEADTWAELRSQVREAVLCHFDEGQAPAVIRLHRVRAILGRLMEHHGVTLEELLRKLGLA